MKPSGTTRKRPCRICRRWYRPNARTAKQQKTCGDLECQRQWHAGKCREWNRNNRAYFREIHLQKRLLSVNVEETTSLTPLEEQRKRPLSPTSLQEVFSIQQLVIIGYLLRLSDFRLQEVIQLELLEKTRNWRRLLPGPRQEPIAAPVPVSYPAVNSRPGEA